MNDIHCHFFSHQFFEALARQQPVADDTDPVARVTGSLGWDAPGTAGQLADRWVAELDRHGVGRAALIASVPGDEASVASAVARRPDRFVGMFMLDPTGADAGARATNAFTTLGLRVVCLFPAMHHVPLSDPRVAAIVETAAQHPGTAVFVHCGVLSVGVRKKLGLPSPFDMRIGNPLDLHVLAVRYPSLPIVIPHFGGGLFREALMVADLCPNVCFDTSSSNGWTKYHPGLTLDSVFRQALAVLGPDRLLFGTDSSFFPRGWQRNIYETQKGVLERLGVDDSVSARIFSGNFDRLFPISDRRLQISD